MGRRIIHRPVELLCDGESLATVVDGQTILAKGISIDEVTHAIECDSIEVSCIEDPPDFRRFVQGVPSYRVTITLAVGELQIFQGTPILGEDLFKDLTVNQLMKMIQQQLEGREG